MAAILSDWSTTNWTEPQAQLRIRYDWNSSTRQYTIYVDRRCGGGGAWFNTAWDASISTTYGSASGQIKPYTSGTIGQNEYTFAGGPWTVPNNANAVDISVSSSPDGGSKSATLTVGYGWTAPSQTFVTRATNNTTGEIRKSGEESYTSTHWELGSTSYAGDSFTYWWDKNNQGSVGVNANPRSTARLCRANTLDYDSSYSTIHMAWDWNFGGDDKNDTFNYTISPDDCGKYVQARLWKAYTNASGGTEQWVQSDGHYISSQPLISGSVTLRSKKFYTNTPSCAVWQLNSYKITSRRYGIYAGANYNYQGYTGKDEVNGKFCVTLDSSGNLDTEVRWGKGAFNENYSIPQNQVLSMHTIKKTISGTPMSNSIIYSNWFNPRTGAVDRLGFKSLDLGRVTVETGSIELPTIDAITPISGNGTTVIVNDTKRIYTNLGNVKIVHKVEHSGNTEGFGYDARVNEDGGPYGSTSIIAGTPLIPVVMAFWHGIYGVIDNSTDTVSIQFDSTTIAGKQVSIAVVPYIRDAEGYQIFGAANSTDGLVTSTPYTIYRIDPPKIPVITRWQNTLPAIDGVKDVINWTAMSPSGWGNVVDFAYGYKMRYRIGNNKPHSDGYEWYFTNNPTTIDTEFSGSFTETYNRDSYTDCTAQLTATSYYSTVWNAYLDFQSDFSTEKSYAIAAKDPYSAVFGTLTTPEPTTLLIDIPFTFKCPSEAINSNSLIQSVKLIVDGNTEVDLPDPEYTMTTPDSLTGQLSVSFKDLKDYTPTLTRGAHTIQVKNEVASYFDSTIPVSNHVYFGTTTVTSNIVNVEVAELPERPTLDSPSPSYFHSGYDKILKFTFSPNDWGCLDTDYNNRHFDYELYNPNGDRISSGIIDKTATQWTYKMVPHETSQDLWVPEIPDSINGIYTFKIRSTSVVGSSNWVQASIEIFEATEPGQSTFESTEILALANWRYNLNVRPGGDGTYSPVATYRGIRLYPDPEFIIGLNECQVYNNMENGSVTITRKAMSDAPNSSKYGLEITTTGPASPGLGGFCFATSTSANKEFIIRIVAKIPLGYELKWFSNQIGARSPEGYGPDAFAITSRTGNGHWKEYYFRVRCGATGEFSSTNFFALTELDVSTGYPSEDLMSKSHDLPVTWYVACADCIEVNSSGSVLMEVPQARMKVDVLKVNEDDEGHITGYIDMDRVEMDWTSHESTDKVDKLFTSQFNGYEDGLYRLRVQYERNYTTEVVKEEAIYEIVPPEVELYNESTIKTCTATSDDVIYHVKLISFAATKESDAWYSLDYGNTWIQLPQSSKNGAYRYYEKDLTLNWLDYIMFKVHGKNPVDEKTDKWSYEMPSNYLVWLSWANRTANDEYRTYPYHFDAEDFALNVERVPGFWYNASQSVYLYGGDVEKGYGKLTYTASEQQSQSVSRGCYIQLHNCMSNNKKYRITFKAKSTRERDIDIRWEAVPISKTIHLTKEYQVFYIEGVFKDKGTGRNSLTFYSFDWDSKEKLCIKEIQVDEVKVVRDNELLRRTLISHDGGDIKKVCRITKH